MTDSKKKPIVKSKLADLIPQSRTIEVQPGKFIELRPITLTDLSVLGSIYDKELGQLINGDINSVNFVTVFPNATGAIIAFSMGEPAEMEQAVKLPIGVQIQIIGEIIQMSLAGTGDLGNVLRGWGDLVMEFKKNLVPEIGKSESPKV